MKTEYAVEIYNKYHDTFVEQIDVFDTYEEAKEFVKTTDIDIDRDCEYFEITEIEYENNEDEIGISRIGLKAE